MMFGRILWKLLRGNGGRLAVALVAVTSGATVIAGLLNLQFDMREKLTQEFRLLGANLVISRGGAEGIRDAGQGALSAGGSSMLMDQTTVLDQVEAMRTRDVVAAAPYLYIIARDEGTPVVVAGTWLDQTPRLDPTWKVDGEWPASRDDESQCLAGRNVAKKFQLSPGSQITLNYFGRNATLAVAGVVDSGGPADNQIFVNLPVAQELADLGGPDGQIELVQMSVSGTVESIGSYAAKLASSLPGYDVRPIRQVTEAEGNLVQRTRLLVASMVVLILALTALCVLATMAALAMERREDVGLMKALGGSMARIVALFLAEVGVLGAVGGLIGCVAGIALARWMGERVFGASIAARWEVFPLTIVMMVVASMAGALPLRALGKVKPAVILRGE